ncbi:MAG: ATP-binding protein [Armatimonadota bacterium]
MTQLAIAGVRCQLKPESGEFVFDPCLTPFMFPTDGDADLSLHLALAPGWRQQHADLPAPLAARKDGHFEFTRSNGFLSASDGFASCHARLDPSEACAFSGQPWLMLALWGYLAHREGLFLHGACCELKGHLILLLGPPQVGKSTLSRLIVATGGAA